jgi:hypothetical protein
VRADRDPVAPPALGGRGTLRPDDIELRENELPDPELRENELFGPLALFDEMPFDETPLLERPKFAPGRAAELPNELALEAAGGVIRLTVARDTARAGAAAAGRPAFRPNLLCMVGLTPGLPNAGALRTALALTRTAFWRTGNPRSSVPRETAVNPPRAFKFA